MNINVFYGILIPFLGTSVGAACVIFMKKNLNAHEGTDWLCVRSYGGCFCLEPFASVN